MTYADRIRAIDTRNLTSREVALMAGCDTSTASRYLKYLGKEWLKMSGGCRIIAPAEPEPEPDPMPRVLGDAESSWARLMRGRSYGGRLRGGRRHGI